jgi:hypothetical protein
MSLSTAEIQARMVASRRRLIAETFDGAAESKKVLLQWESVFLNELQVKGREDDSYLANLGIDHVATLHKLHRIYAKPKAERDVMSAATGHLAVRQAIDKHYRDAAKESRIDYSPAWKDARMSIRFLNHVSPLLLGVIQRPGSNADIEARKDALTFLTTSTDSLAKIISTSLAPTKEVKEYERLELNSTLSHVVGNLWERSARQDPYEQIDELLVTVTGMFSDAQFLAANEKIASRMMDLAGYRKVDAPETMESRLRISFQNAVMGFYQAAIDRRICNSKGDPFTYGKPVKYVVLELANAFDRIVGNLVMRHEFSDSLSNDQRASVMQSWMRNAAEIVRAEYVAVTERGIDWFKAAEKLPGGAFSERFNQVKASFGQAIMAVENFTEETMSDLIAVGNMHASTPKSDYSEALSSAPKN